MSREAKLTKWNLINRSGKYRSISEAAEDLGVARGSLYRALGRFGVAAETLLRPKETPSAVPAVLTESITEPTAPAAAVVPNPEPAFEPAEPERDARRLTAADFSGAFLGESTRLNNRPGSVDELFNRYNRLKNY